MGLPRVFGLCVAVLFASSVSAAVTIDVGPSDYRVWGTGPSAHTSSGLRSSMGQTIKVPPSNASLSVTRNAVIPYGSLANGMRSFLRVNPASVAASAAVTTLFLAVDWAWDELEQQWVKYESVCPPDSFCSEGTYDVGSMCDNVPYALTEVGQSKTVVASRSRGPIPQGAVVNLVVSYGAPSSSYVHINNCVDRYPSGRWPTKNGYFPALYGYIVSDPAQPELRPVTPPFSELEAYLPSADPSTVGTAGHDTMRRIGSPLPGYQDQTMTGPSSFSGPETTTTTTTETGDNVVTTTQTTTHITYGDTTITTTETTVTNTYTNGNLTGTQTTTEIPGELPVTEPAATEWPVFCEWASIVCDWIDWTREEPDAEPDLPKVMDDDFYQHKSIQFGSKTCPPDYEINIAFLDTTVGVSMQPLCDFAGIIYYMVMAAAYIIAAYISIGVVRNG